jgi:hypothetical protein
MLIGTALPNGRQDAFQADMVGHKERHHMWCHSHNNGFCLISTKVPQNRARCHGPLARYI